MVTFVCPDCHESRSGGGNFVDRSGCGYCTVACPACHAERVRRVREIEARYPSAEQLGLIGNQDKINEVPALRTVRPHSSGRRVIRKSEPMGG